MKKIWFVLSTVLLLSFISLDTPLSKKERKFATKFLQDTESGVINAVKGLSDAQLKYKTAADKWSVEECVKHIAATEPALWQMTEGTIKQPADAAKRAELKSTDEQVIQMIESRSQKVQTSENFKPENIPYKTTEEALESFRTNRAKLIEYVKTTNEDLRNHVATLPFASFDCYQMVLFIGAHSKRHTHQIEEIKADPNFPKN